MIDEAKAGADAAAVAERERSGLDREHAAGQVRARQVAALIRQMPYLAGGHLANSALVAWLFRDMAAPAVLFSWVALLWLGAFAQLRMWLHGRQRPLPVSVSQRPVTRAILGSLLFGVLWGTGVVLLFPTASPIYQVVLVFIVGGMAAGAVAALASLPAAYVAYVVPSMLPLVVRLLLIGDRPAVAMAATLTFFCLALLLICRSAYIGFVETVEVEVEKAALATQLAKAGERLEARVALRTTELTAVNDRLFAEVNERQRVETELRDSEERYRNLFDHLPFAIWEQDWSQVKARLAAWNVANKADVQRLTSDQLRALLLRVEVLHFNPAAVALYRAVDEATLSRSPVTRLPEAALPAYGELVAALLGGDERFSLETEEQADDGAAITVRTVVNISPDFRADWSRVVVTQEDVTERRAMMEQLGQVYRMEAVGHLTGGVAHDFNNLLAVIYGNLERLMLQLAPDSELQEMAQQAKEAAERGATLTRRLLAFSRQQALQPRPVDVNALITGLLDLLCRTLGETVTIKTSLAPGLAHASIDPGQLENALVNLAVNGRDAMPTGGTLEVRTASLELDAAAAARLHLELPPAPYVTVTVDDTGTGMSPETVLRAFDPFYTTKDVGEGSGLGLSMVYGFVKQSGGDVSLASERGRGTTVQLYLPQAAQEQPVEAPAVIGEGNLPHGEGETILVVEDDPAVRSYVVQLLDFLGYQTLEAQDGPTALRCLETSTDVALLFSDVVLPGGMSGPQLARAARDRWGEFKVLFTSGYPRDAVLKDGRLDGAELVEKPFSAAVLAVKLRQTLAS